MSPSEPAQLDLTRRYARELRRLHAEARRTLRRNEASVREAAGTGRGEPPASASARPREHEVVTPGIGHA